MRHVVGLLSCVAVLSVAPAAPAAGAAVRFLGRAPVGPLAKADAGGVQAPEPRACRSWGPVGSRWLTLDAFGRVVGEAKVAKREYYDVSDCDELEMRRVRGQDGAGLYVDARAGYRAPQVSAFQPDAPSRAALERAAARGPLGARAFFFSWGPSAERYAVVGGPSLLVFVWRGGAWTKEREVKTTGLTYEAFAVTDMDADGRPEVVFHAIEGGGEFYGDGTLSSRPNGAWTEIEAGIYGSTA
jgi:hypothetical protein